jgi:hypothetical protein
MLRKRLNRAWVNWIASNLLPKISFAEYLSGNYPDITDYLINPAHVSFDNQVSRPIRHRGRGVVISVSNEDSTGLVVVQYFVPDNMSIEEPHIYTGMWKLSDLIDINQLELYQLKNDLTIS